MLEEEQPLLPVLDVLFKDDDIVVIHKPAGMLVHRSKLDSRETVFVMQTLRDQIDQHVFPVHRLDKPTSGVMVFALSSEMARELNQQFIEHSVRKDYIAIVRGFIDKSGVIDYPLKEKHDKIADKKANKEKEAQSAITEFTCVKQIELPHAVGRYPSARYSLVKLSPKTGRKHQLRRHMSHLRHPIVGDVNHGDTKHNKFYRSQFDCHRLLLMAYRLRFFHPRSGEPLDFYARIDEEFERLFDFFDWTVNIAAL